MSLRHYAFLIVVAAFVTLLVTPLVRGYAIRHGLVQKPRVRDIHTKPVPRLGGIALFSGVIVAIGVQALGEIYLGWGGMISGGGTVRTRMTGVLIGFVVIFIVGLIDDLRPLSPGWKLVGQIAAASVLVVFGLRIEYVGNPFGGGLIELGFLAIPITLLYVVAFTNIVNLIDGLDGLAAGVTAISAVSFLAIAAQGNRLEAAAVAAALIGACAGFVRYNFHPASIIMGDSGALFLGFVLASVSLMGVLKSTAAIALAVPLLIMGVPIADTASAIIRRVAHRRPIGEADRGHIHHRLLGRGFDQRQTVLIIYGWSALLALGGWAVRFAGGPIKTAAFVILFLITGLMVYWLGLFEVAQRSEDGNRKPE